MTIQKLLNGTYESPSEIFALLKLNESDIRRFRGCWINENRIVIHTRVGGRNRKDYMKDIKKLQNHKNYLYDEDCDEDCTYANFYFSIPEMKNDN